MCKLHMKARSWTLPWCVCLPLCFVTHQNNQVAIPQWNDLYSELKYLPAVIAYNCGTEQNRRAPSGSWHSSSYLGSSFDMSGSRFFLVHLAAELQNCVTARAFGNKRFFLLFQGFLSVIVAVGGQSEQLGFAVSSDGGWLNLGNIALNVTVMVSNCKISEFEMLTLISYAAYRTLSRKKLWKSGKRKFVMHTLKLNQSWTVLSSAC